MIPRPKVIPPPLDNPKTIELERQLATLFGLSAQYRSGVYIGDGVSGKVLAVEMNVKAIAFVHSSPVSTASQLAFALRTVPGVTFLVDGGNNIVDGVLEFTRDWVVLGTSDRVNGAGVNYAYFAIG